MCVHAIDLNEAKELCFRLLSKILEGEETHVCKRVKYGELAGELQVSEEDVRYNLKKLVKLGYLRVSTAGYEPTEKVLFISEAG